MLRRMIQDAITDVIKRIETVLALQLKFLLFHVFLLLSYVAVLFTIYVVIAGTDSFNITGLVLGGVAALIVTLLTYVMLFESFFAYQKMLYENVSGWWPMFKVMARNTPVGTALYTAKITVPVLLLVLGGVLWFFVPSPFNYVVLLLALLLAVVVKFVGFLIHVPFVLGKRVDLLLTLKKALRKRETYVLFVWFVLVYVSLLIPLLNVVTYFFLVPVINKVRLVYGQRL